MVDKPTSPRTFLYSILEFPLSIANKAKKCVCKIITKSVDKGLLLGTGFFMKVKNSHKYLVTASFVISDAIINKTEIEVETYNEKRIIIKCTDRFTKIFEHPSPIAVIEMKESDNIFNDIDFFDYDMDYVKGYSIYKNVDVF